MFSRQPRSPARSRSAPVAAIASAFSVKFGEVSTKIVDRKCDAIAAAGADAVVGGDLGCLMNMAGKLHRRGSKVRCYHTIEIIAGGGAGPAIGETP